MKQIPRNIREIARKLRNNMTKAEICLWNEIKNEQLWVKFLRQKPIYLMTENDWRERYIIPDFYCAQKKIILEVDGEVHQNNEVLALDKAKQALLEKQWYSVIRIRNEDILFDMHDTLKKIRMCLKNSLPLEKKGVPERGGIINTWKIRCAWAENASELEQKYHDEEWGREVHDDRVFFEFLVLEWAQAGLSWSTILKKRENYRKAFDDFDYEKIAQYWEDKIQDLLQDEGIVRNKLKIRSVVKNAQVFLEIQKDFGSFDSFIWAFVGNKQIKNNWEKSSQVPVSTPISDAISKDLKKRGMSFVWTTIMYAFMQATGLVNDHTVDCEIYKTLKE